MKTATRISAASSRSTMAMAQCNMAMIKLQVLLTLHKSIQYTVSDIRARGRAQPQLRRHRLGLRFTGMRMCTGLLVLVHDL